MAKIRRIVWVGAGLAALAALAALTLNELQASRLQSGLWSGLARDASYSVEAGASDAIRYPGAGPYDLQLGYHELPGHISRLQSQGYVVTRQARMSPRMIELREHGLFIPYREKNQAGLTLLDCRAQPLLRWRTPQRIYEGFEAVPPLLVDALLFIEDRHLLDARQPQRNPAIDPERLAKAMLEQMHRALDPSQPAAGGSTLATQIEKYRHSPHGRTESAGEKFRQMASASLRSYLDGEDTLPRRRQILVDYLNTVPLAARPGFGEVHGLGDGLWVWYGRDFDEVMGLLADAAKRPQAGAAPSAAELARQAVAFKQVLSLLVAQRRPAHYLLGQRAGLEQLTDSTLRRLAEAGLITPTLRDAALRAPLQQQAEAPPLQRFDFVQRKAVTATRSHLSALLDMPRAYDLDRLDLDVQTPMDGVAQALATQALVALRSPAAAKAAGLVGTHLLADAAHAGRLVFSLTLFERSAGANLLRVQADNIDQPFDVNRGARLDLGSTAKLRTLISYLEIVAALHARWAGLDVIELSALNPHDRDALALWARHYLVHAQDRGLDTMLEAAMDRRYSASPAEAFFTGGGLHRFENFEPEHNGRSMTVREAFRHSVNLVFIRLMRDIVQHHLADDATETDIPLPETADARRRELLARFADREGSTFLERFYRKYAGRSAADAQALLLRGVRPSAPRLASVMLAIDPAASAAQLGELLRRQLGDDAIASAELRSLHHSIGRLSLTDLGVVSRVHPLELWLVGHLRRHPAATLAEVLAASPNERQEVYAWLVKTRHRGAQEQRIRTLLERDAFARIHGSWRRLGYPFESLTPSYATALGASGDRPAALAELMGIIANGGARLPTQRVDALHFARDTPYETRLEQRSPAAEQVLAREAAAVVRHALVEVVAQGTARRLKGALMGADGRAIEVGGKTGTGDHRYKVTGPGGRLISERVINRSATFVFMIGERYFGTVMAYAQGPDAARYRFTSALPVQLLKSLGPPLLAALHGSGCGGEVRQP